jgi:hypothetical protein
MFIPCGAWLPGGSTSSERVPASRLDGEEWPLGAPGSERRTLAAPVFAREASRSSMASAPSTRKARLPGAKRARSAAGGDSSAPRLAAEW